MTKTIEMKNGSKMFFTDDDVEDIGLGVGGIIRVITGEMLGYTLNSKHPNCRHSFVVEDSKED